MRYRALLILLLSHAAYATPNILTLNPAADSGVTYTPGAVTATAGSSVINNPLYIDQDAYGAPLIVDSGNPSATTIVSMANPSGGAVNHAPYQVIVLPASGFANFESSYYAQLQSQVAVVSATHGVGDAANHQLYAVATTVSSPNSHDGTTGWGITFGLSVSYLGLITTSDSGDSGIVGGFLGALLYNHPSWNAFDAHAALRVSAGNWTSGYDHTNYGYGFINWTAANAVSTIYLQPADMEITNNGYYARVTLYPFRQTRRNHEVVYIGGTWPSPATGCSGSTCNEYTSAQIAAAGGTLVYTSNGTDVTPTFSYAPAASGTATFYVLTIDASGNGSRVDEYNAVSETFVVGAVCH